MTHTLANLAASFILTAAVAVIIGAAFAPVALENWKGK